MAARCEGNYGYIGLLAKFLDRAAVAGGCKLICRLIFWMRRDGYRYPSCKSRRSCRPEAPPRGKSEPFSKWLSDVVKNPNEDAPTFGARAYH
jgi:hypothetical protein